MTSNSEGLIAKVSFAMFVLLSLRDIIGGDRDNARVGRDLHGDILGPRMLLSKRSLLGDGQVEFCGLALSVQCSASSNLPGWQAGSVVCPAPWPALAALAPWPALAALAALAALSALAALLACPARSQSVAKVLKISFCATKSVSLFTWSTQWPGQRARWLISCLALWLSGCLAARQLAA